MSENKKPQRNVDEALTTLREGYEQSADHDVAQPEPIEGKEIRERRWPLLLSYLIGLMAVVMLVTAVFLFNLQIDRSTSPAVVTGDGSTSTSETVIIDPIGPTPIFAAEVPLFDEEIPLPPEPTPWPTPPIAPDDASG